MDANRQYKLATTPFAAIPRIIPTLVCNFRCPYCVMDYPQPTHEILSAEKWIYILNNLPGDSVIFSGGEPTLINHLPDIINGLAKNDIRVYTNMSRPFSYWQRLDRTIHILASYHHGQGISPRAVAELFQQLRDAGHYIGSHVIESANTPADDIAIFDAVGIDIKTDIDIRNLKAWKNRGSIPAVLPCKTTRILIGPDGKRYPCLHKLVKANPGDVMTTMTFPNTVECREGGSCHVCDVAIFARK